MNVLWFEFMLSLRRLWRRKTQNGLMLLTFAVSLTLALLSWSLFHTIFLRQPDFDPRGEYYFMTFPDLAGPPRWHSSAEELEAYAAGQTVFSEFTIVGISESVFIRTPSGAERSTAAYLSSRALQLTGAKPILGRLFTAADDARNAEPLVLMSQRMWENDYRSDPHIVGKTIEVTGWPVTIVGVLPRSYRFPNDQDLWLSLGHARNHPFYPMRDAMVKLKPGITRERAEQDMQVLLDGFGPQSEARQNAQRTGRNAQRLGLLPLRDFYLLPEIKVSATILFCLALIFVMVSCANAANLMLVDFLGRRSEIAASLALGIPRRAAIRAVGCQVMVIAASAALLSIACLPIAGPLLYERIKIVTVPYWLGYHFEWHYAGMAFALGALSAVVTLIAPICYLLLVDPDQVIREHATTSRGTGRALWRRVLLTGQIALLTVLGVCAGLLVRSSFLMGASHRGYPAHRIFMGKVSVAAIDYPRETQDQEQLVALRQTLAQVELRPTTAGAALSDNGPGAYSSGPFCTYALDPATFSAHTANGQAFCSRVTEGFFTALDVPFVAGRMFPRENPDQGPTYGVINESLAGRLWPGQDPLQRVLYVRYRGMKETDPPERVVICGVVRDFQASGPVAVTNDCIVTPFKPGDGAGNSVFLLVRDQTGAPPARSLTEAVHRADPRISLYFPSTIKGQIDVMLSSVRMTTGLTVAFAAAAVLLCAIGVYSLTVAQVLQSSRAFGIRMALGAEPQQLWLYFTRGHLLAALLGVGLGSVGATQVVRVLGSLLYGVNPHSVPTYVGVALTILFVAALACIPSLFRLRRINPAECLRSL